MLVSLFTDASWCPRTYVGGWGAWAKCELGVVQGGGPMKRSLSGSNEAEARAVYAGLLLIAKTDWMGPAERVLVQLDNLHVVGVLHQKSAKVPKVANRRDLDFIVAVREYEQQHGVIVMAKHVKGHAHRSLGERRNWVNHYADRHAYKGLQEARAWAGLDKAAKVENGTT